MRGLYLTSDLMFSSRVTSLASQCGVEVQVLGDSARFLTTASASVPDFLLIDLTSPLPDARAWLTALREACPAVPLVAYAPHVHEARLSLAREAGCTTVLTRGQFDRLLPELIAAGFRE